MARSGRSGRGNQFARVHNGWAGIAVGSGERQYASAVFCHAAAAEVGQGLRDRDAESRRVKDRAAGINLGHGEVVKEIQIIAGGLENSAVEIQGAEGDRIDRKSTRLNSSHRCISYAVF